MLRKSNSSRNTSRILIVMISAVLVGLSGTSRAADALDSVGDDLFGQSAPVQKTDTVRTQSKNNEVQKQIQPEKKQPIPEQKPVPLPENPPQPQPEKKREAMKSQDKKGNSFLDNFVWTDADVEKIQVVKDNTAGWKIQINGKDFFIKGVEWTPIPIGEKYSYNLWDQDEKIIRQIVDGDMTMLKSIGCNAVRTFTVPPPKWVYYIYKTYGIHVLINDMMGRYGVTVRGRWVIPTDYSDPETRKILKNEALSLIRLYRNVPGVLFFFFGNENNYGLEWKSADIENLPVGERMKVKAKTLYGLFQEIIAEGKKLDQNHPFGIVNGDIQYLEIIKDQCPSLDILGANVYRGQSATDLFERVKNMIDKPFMFTEFGCDAYNAKTSAEDQYHQALFLKDQWKEIFHKSYGKSEEQNCIGGFTFGFIDGWWKSYGGIQNTDVHDTTASWANAGYGFDFSSGKNNINEEWWGICAQSPQKVDGVNVRIPRTAYYLLSDIFKIDPLNENTKSIDTYIDKLSLSSFVSMGEANNIKNSFDELQRIRINSGKIFSEMVLTGSARDPDPVFSKTLYANLGLTFNPIKNLTGSLSFNVATLAADKIVEKNFYGDRIKPVGVLSTNTDLKKLAKNSSIINNNPIEIYSAAFDYNIDSMELKSFYHIGHENWLYEGDFFGIMADSFYLDIPDIWNDKSPFGIEFIGKDALEGLKVIGGPEVYWGANPRVMAKYYKKLGPINFAVMHSEDIGQQATTSGIVSGTIPKTRKSSLYMKLDLIPKVDLEVGGLWAGSEKIGQPFWRAVKSSGSGYLGSGYDIIMNDSIHLLDTFGTRVVLAVSPTSFFGLNGEFNLDGLVADAGNVPGVLGSTINSGGTGNKIEYRGGMNLYFGDIQIYLKYLNRKPLVAALPFVKEYSNNGNFYQRVRPRNILDDPFAVIGNREAQTFEVVLLYDPTGITWFFDWDNDDKEDAKFAADLVFDYSIYPTKTDSGTFVDVANNNQATMPFGYGLPAANVWQISSRIISNPADHLKIIGHLSVGDQQSTGGATNMVMFYAADFNVGYKGLGLAGFVKKNAWGGLPGYDWYRQWNITYPWQFEGDLSYAFSRNSFISSGSKIGLKIYFLTLSNTMADFASYGDSLFESSLYYQIIF